MLPGCIIRRSKSWQLSMWVQLVELVQQVKQGYPRSFQDTNGDSKVGDNSVQSVAAGVTCRAQVALVLDSLWYLKP